MEDERNPIVDEIFVSQSDEWQAAFYAVLAINPDMDAQEAWNRVQRYRQINRQGHDSHQVAIDMQKDTFHANRLIERGLNPDEWVMYGSAHPDKGWTKEISELEFTDEDLENKKKRFPRGIELLAIQGLPDQDNQNLVTQTGETFYVDNTSWALYIRVKPDTITS